MESQFKQHGLNQAETLGEDYDKDSIMHYGKYVNCCYFSHYISTKPLDTTDTVHRIVLGQRKALTFILVII